jgi:hypothetical protein
MLFPLKVAAFTLPFRARHVGESPVARQMKQLQAGIRAPRKAMSSASNNE